MELSRLSALLSVPTPDASPKDAAAQPQGVNFGDVLKQAMNQVEQDQVVAEDATYRLATGQTQDITAVMVATEKANLSLSLAIQVRNKALEAYQEIMRMPL